MHCFAQDSASQTSHGKAALPRQTAIQALGGMMASPSQSDGNQLHTQSSESDRGKGCSRARCPYPHIHVFTRE